MANLGYVSTFNINGNELSLKDAALTEIVEEIIEAIGANNGDISDRINNLHERSFDALIKISSQDESEIESIQDGMYKLQYVTITGEGDEATETLNNSAILIQTNIITQDKGGNKITYYQYLYKNGLIFKREKTSTHRWSQWSEYNIGVTSFNGATGAITYTAPVTSVNGQTGAVTINVGVTSFNGATGAITYNAPVTSVNGQTGAVNITIPTKTSDLTNDSNFTTLSEVQTEIVGAAPEQLNTLAELADALNDDQNFASTVTNLIGQKYTKPSTGIPASDLADGVQTNLTLASTALQSFTETDPTVPSHVKNITSQDIINWNNKLSSAPVTSVNGETGAVSLALGDTNVIETIKVNNTALTPVSKAVNITVPTKVSDLTNDSNFTSNVGTITGITMNGVSKGNSGIVDLGTVLTSHQDISGKVDKVTGMGLSSNDYTTTEKNKLAGINIGSLDSLTTTELNSIFS